MSGGNPSPLSYRFGLRFTTEHSECIEPTSDFLGGPGGLGALGGL